MSTKFSSGNASFFRHATAKDVTEIREILLAAVRRMLAEGKQQWDYNYPTETHVRSDINQKIGYVLEENGKVVAYGAVVFDGEPAYLDIDGQWIADDDYVVVHRMAVDMASQCKGLGQKFLESAAELALSKGIRYFRVDTNFDNERMLNLIGKLGFTYCGEIRYKEGSRKAFEKRIATDSDA